MKRRERAGYVLVLVLVALVSSAYGCGSNTGNDAGTDRYKGKRTVYNMPDGWANLASVCVSGVVVVLADRGDTVRPVPIDPAWAPQCRGLDGVSPPKGSR